MFPVLKREALTDATAAERIDDFEGACFRGNIALAATLDEDKDPKRIDTGSDVEAALCVSSAEVECGTTIATGVAIGVEVDVDLIDVVGDLLSAFIETYTGSDSDTDVGSDGLARVIDTAGRLV